MNYTAEQINNAKTARDIASDASEKIRELTGGDLSFICEPIPLKDYEFRLSLWTPDIPVGTWYVKDLDDLRVKIGVILKMYMEE